MSQDATRFLQEIAADFDLRPLLEANLPEIDFTTLHSLAVQRGYDIDQVDLRSALRVFKRLTSNPLDETTQGLLG